LFRDDGSTVPLPGSTLKPATLGSKAPANVEIFELSMTTPANKSFSVFMYFEIFEPNLTQWLGWGRQQILIPYKPHYFVDGQNVGDIKTESGRAAQMQIAISNRSQQKIIDPSPGAGLKPPGEVSWDVPNNSITFYAQATVENVVVRYFANLGSQVFFLALGVLLGGLPTILSKWESSAEEKRQQASR
jgi:hypothetical protein